MTTFQRVSTTREQTYHQDRYFDAIFRRFSGRSSCMKRGTDILDRRDRRNSEESNSEIYSRKAKFELNPSWKKGLNCPFILFFPKKLPDSLLILEKITSSYFHFIWYFDVESSDIITYNTLQELHAYLQTFFHPNSLLTKYAPPVKDKYNSKRWKSADHKRVGMYASQPSRQI